MEISIVYSIYVHSMVALYATYVHALGMHALYLE